MVLGFNCLERENEVVESIGKLANLEEMDLKMEVSLTCAHWTAIYNSNLFLGKLTFGGEMSLRSMDPDTRKLLHQFKCRRYHYRRLCYFLDLLEDAGLMDEIRMEHIQNTLDYMGVDLVWLLSYCDRAAICVCHVCY